MGLSIAHHFRWGGDKVMNPKSCETGPLHRAFDDDEVVQAAVKPFCGEMRSYSGPASPRHPATVFDPTNTDAAKKS
jgi:hypothetical protein